MTDALQLDRVRAGYGETVVLEDVGFTLAERGSALVIPNEAVFVEGNQSFVFMVKSDSTVVRQVLADMHKLEPDDGQVENL